MSQTYTLVLDPAIPEPPIIPLIWAEQVDPPQVPEKMPPYLAAVVDEARRTGEGFIPPEVRARVRKMLRFGKYRASGRGKPASEFLLRAALEERFPVIGGPVDVNNAISLSTGFPGSLFDADRTGPDLLLRHGREGEAYVFNRSGQTIDLQDLLLVCRKAEFGWEPCGNPVKDSMTTKIGDGTRNVLAVLYVPADEPPDAAEVCAARYAELLETECGAQRVGFTVVTGGGAP